MRVLIYGGNTEGAFLAARLAQAGHTVTLTGAGADEVAGKGEVVVLTWQGKQEIARGIAGTADVSAAFAQTAYDWIGITLPAYETTAAGQMLGQYCAHPAPVVTFQTGTGHVTTLQTMLGHEDVTSGAITATLARPEPHVIQVIRPGGISLGGTVPPAVAGAIAGTGLEVRQVENAEALEWSKLFVDMIGNALSAALDELPPEVFGDYRLFDVEWAGLNETLWVIEQQGIDLVDLPGAPARRLATIVRRLPRQLTRLLLIWQLQRTRGEQPPSLLRELRAGQAQTEAAWLNGAVVLAAHTLDYLVPVNHALALTVSDIAAGRAPWEMFRHNPDMLLRSIRMAQGLT